MKRTGITKYLTLSLAAIMTINLAACGTGEKTAKVKAQSGAQAEDIEHAISQVIGNGQSGAADKEETVYVFTDAKGNTKHITVSNWLKNQGGDSTLTDSTDLTDIENVQGDETFTADGKKLTW